MFRHPHVLGVASPSSLSSCVHLSPAPQYVRERVTNKLIGIPDFNNSWCELVAVLVRTVKQSVKLDSAQENLEALMQVGLIQITNIWDKEERKYTLSGHRNVQSLWAELAALEAVHPHMSAVVGVVLEATFTDG